jgi:S1-C subfamily serine protease
LTRALLAAVSFVLLAVPAAWGKSEKSKTVQRALRQSVRIEVLVKGQVVRTASGVVVAAQRQTSYVLTNEHVVQREGLSGNATIQVVVERPKLHRLKGRVIFEGRVPEEDLALLAVEGEALPASELAAEAQVDVGDDVVVIGAPYGRALSVSSGIVSQLDPEDQDRPMKTDAPIGYGASGGGVFDVSTGKLVGLVEGYRTAKVSFAGISKDEFSFDVPMPGETFLSPPSKIRGFLARSGVGRMMGLHDARPLAPALAAPVAGVR